MSNIINAIFDGSRRKAITCPLFQYDYGQILKISGIELPASYQVQFSNTEDAGVSKTMLGDADGVQIPDEYLLTGDYIYAFVYLHETEDDGETEYVIEIPVIRRPAPSEETPTPAEQSLIDQLLAQLNQGVEAAEEAADQAGQAAETAVAGMIDDTLTIQGKAADAKATGDELTQLKSDLTDETTAREEADTAINEALETKAEIDGYYDEMAVGSAEQLISTVLTVDEEPYKFRTSGGSKDIGNRETDKIVGGSIVWNQLMQNTSSDKSKTDNGVTITDNRDGTFTVSTDSNGATANTNIIGSNVSLKAGHKYYFAGTPKTGSRTTYNSYMINTTIMSTAYDVGNGCIFSPNTDGTASTVAVFVASGTIITSPVIFKPICIDLTAMFGADVADYIYSLERASAGAGVAYFKKLFPNDYYAYNSGEMMHVSGLQSHDMVGFNQWDEEWEVGALVITTGAETADAGCFRSKNYIRLIPNATYFVHGTALRFCFYDADKNFIESPNSITNTTFTVPQKAVYGRFYKRVSPTVYNHDICINRSWSGYRNGEYEPYKKHSYALDSSLTLRGIPEVGTDGLYFDGDTYESDGTVTRRYGIVDLGTLEWAKTQTSVADVNRFYTSSLSNLIKNVKNNATIAKMVCDKYVAITFDNLYVSAAYGIALSTGNVLSIIDDSYNGYSAAQFKSAMSGVYLVYELATPTTETAEQYTNPQIVDDFGTEEYVSETIVPVGHYTEYQANLRDKLQHLPDLADDDGYYVIQQTDHQMTLKNFRIPQAPTADGTYILKATVSGGTPTYTWESEA